MLKLKHTHQQMASLAAISEEKGIPSDGDVDRAYLTWKEFLEDFDRDDYWFGSGVLLLVNWGWQMSFDQKHPPRREPEGKGENEDEEEDLERLSKDLTDEEKLNNKSKYDIYQTQSYVIINSASVYNKGSRIVKIYVTPADDKAVREYIKKEAKISNKFLTKNLL